MYQYDLITYDTEKFEFSNLGSVSVYNTDFQTSLSETIKNSKNPFEIGLMFDTNNIYKSDSGVYFNNGIKTNNVRMIKVGSDNINKSFEYFSARKLVKTTWINQKDEFLLPKFDSGSYPQFSIDSIIYSLFHTQNGTISSVELNNEFFWMSVEKMKELADQNGYDELYNDARTSSDRYVHNLLFGEERIYDRLSPDAKAVLDKATELVERSMELRQVMANDENHLNSWDAGYAQLKLVWKEYFQEEFKEFRQLYKVLEDRMRPLVYELGFLKK